MCLLTHADREFADFKFENQRMKLETGMVFPEIQAQYGSQRNADLHHKLIPFLVSSKTN